MKDELSIGLGIVGGVFGVTVTVIALWVVFDFVSELTLRLLLLGFILFFVNIFVSSNFKLKVFLKRLGGLIR